MRRLIFDLDGTLTSEGGEDYVSAIPNIAVINKLREYKNMGYEIVISTSRNIRTYKGNLGKINIHTLPVVLNWLQKHDVPHDEVYMGKPWCGTEGFYVDDKAIRPQEFLELNHKQICEKLGIKC